MSNEVELEWKGKSHHEITIRGHKIQIDEPIESGGDNLGPTPKRLMLASLAGCTALDVVSILEKMRVKITGLHIKVVAELTDEHPKIYKSAHLIYRVTGKNINHSKVEKAVQLSQDKYCGVSAMFKKFADVSYEIQYS